MSTPDPYAPAHHQQPGGPDETAPTASAVQSAPDDYGTPSPPDRGAQHDFDAPPAAPPESEAYAWPATGQPTRTAYPPPYESSIPMAYPQPSPAPYPATGTADSAPPPIAYSTVRPDGFGPPSVGYSTPQGAYPSYGYPPYGYPPVDPYAKSRTVAGILGILLGGLGVHRFYLGYVGIGVLQIVVTVLTFGVGAVWGFVEGILYLTQRVGQFSVDSTGRYLRE